MIIRFNRRLIMALVGAATASHAAAQVDCSDKLNQDLPAALSFWRTPVSLRASSVETGRALRVPLAPEGADGKFGTALTFEANKAGIYEIYLSETGWIDVIKDGAILKSTAHRHGPDCSTIRKIVSFTLAPGRYTIRITRSPKSDTTLAILPA